MIILNSIIKYYTDWQDARNYTEISMIINIMLLVCFVVDLVIIAAS